MPLLNNYENNQDFNSTKSPQSVKADKSLMVESISQNARLDSGMKFVIASFSLLLFHSWIHFVVFLACGLFGPAPICFAVLFARKSHSSNHIH